MPDKKDKGARTSAQMRPWGASSSPNRVPRPRVQSCDTNGPAAWRPFPLLDAAVPPRRELKKGPGRVPVFMRWLADRRVVRVAYNRTVAPSGCLGVGFDLWPRRARASTDPARVPFIQLLVLFNALLTGPAVGASHPQGYIKKGALTSPNSTHALFYSNCGACVSARLGFSIPRVYHGLLNRDA